MTEYKYIAHYQAGNENEEFKTLEEAKKWLKTIHDEDGCYDGFAEESCNGGDYIALITHISKFIVEQDKTLDGFVWDEEAGGWFNSDNEEWVFEHVGRIDLVEINPNGEK